MPVKGCCKISKRSPRILDDKTSCAGTLFFAFGNDLAATPTSNAKLFVTDLTDQDALNRVWGEYFRDAKPATTTVQVVRLATDPRCLVEINAVAVID